MEFGTNESVKISANLVTDAIPVEVCWMQIRPACLFFLSPLVLPHPKERLFPTPCVLHTCEGTPDEKPDGSVSYTILDFKTDFPCEGHHGLE